MISHIIGAAMGAVILAVLIAMFVIKREGWAFAGGLIYAFSMIALYTVSSVYHGLRREMPKKVMQVIDHCTIYMLIAGSYTPILLSALRPHFPVCAWSVFAAEWLLAAVGAVFTAIDHKRYGKLSMACYIGMGWLVLAVFDKVLLCLPKAAVLLLFLGGVSYTVGAVLYGLGGKRPWLHTVFHVFVLLGSALQAAAILIYVL